MKLVTWQVAVGTALVGASAIVYIAQIAVFGRAGDTLFYLFQDLAFLPVQVLLVTLILNEFFKRREKAALEEKMNMVIGAFFSEVGTPLLGSLSAFDAGREDLRASLDLKTYRSDADFESAVRKVRDHDFRIDARAGDLEGLKVFLVGRRLFLLGLLENPNLLEHESFTELLWAVFHLTEEFAFRRTLTNLPEADLNHLAGDLKRAHSRLLSQWLSYNRHLRTAYPYIYSLVQRTNPFDPKASVEMRG